MPIKLPENSTYTSLGIDKTANFWRSAKDFIGRLRPSRGAAYMPGAARAVESSGTSPSTAARIFGAAGIGGLAGAGAKHVAGRLADEPLQTESYIQDRKHHNLFDRIRADELVSEKVLAGLGQGFGKTVGGALGGAVAGGAVLGTAKTYDLARKAHKRKKVLNHAVRSDEVLSQTPRGQVQEAYNTMSRFAPTLAEDSNATRSVLREAATHGAGMDYATIRNLAQAEESARRGSTPHLPVYTIGG